MGTQKKIGVLGAANLDITGFPDNKLISGDANIGTTDSSAGGVGRNIAENLLRLGFNVDLISVFGDDTLSDSLIHSCKELGLHIDHSIFLKNASTATFLAVMDHHNDLSVGISAMNIYNELTTEMFQDKIQILKSADYIVLETNFSKEILDFVVKKTPDKKFVLDTVSGVKALRAKDILPHLHILKTNLLEAQMLSNQYIENGASIEQLIGYFIDKGVKNVFITLGKDGVAYGNSENTYQMPPIPSTVVNTIGAGDSFVSGIVYADAHGYDIHQMAKYGMASASINVRFNGAVSPKMKAELLEKIVLV